MLEQRVQQHFFDSADLAYHSGETQARAIAQAAQALFGCITAGGKVLACGIGPGHALAGYFSAMLLGRLERERPPLAAMALGYAAPAVEPGDIALSVQQLQALGHTGDVLVVLDHQGHSPTLVQAVHAAHAKEMSVVALTGRHGHELAAALGETDVHIAIAHDRVARVREQHVLVLHALCDAIDLQLLGDQEPT